MSPVDSYLAELGRRLRSKLPKDVAEARLREARSHLEEAAKAEGEAAALRRFGPPAANARAIVRQARGYDAKSAASLSWAVGLALAAAFVLPHAWMNRHLVTLGPEFLLSVWLPFFAVLLFAARCLRTRRWLVLPASLWAAAGIGLLFVFSGAFPPRLNASDRAVNLKWARGSVARWEREAQDVAAWRAGRTPLNAAPVEARSNTLLYVAGLPIVFAMGERRFLDSFRHEMSPATAQAAWREHGEAWAAQVAVARTESAKALAAAEAGFVHPYAPWSVRAQYHAAGIAQIVAVLLAFNALALLLGRIADRTPLSGRQRRTAR